MSGRRGGRKANIHMSKPELPAFLQRMKEQIVANEDNERKEQAQRKRKEQPGLRRALNDDDDDPTVVQLAEGDLTEEEYKRMKRDLDTQYKLDADSQSVSNSAELNVDDLIKSRGSGAKHDLGETPLLASSSRVKKAASGSNNKKKLQYDNDDESSSSSS